MSSIALHYTYSATLLRRSLFCGTRPVEYICQNTVSRLTKELFRYLHKVHKGVVNACTVWQPETTAGTEFVEEEEFLLSPDLAVITFLSLLEEQFVFRKLLGLRESDAINSLECIVILVCQEIAGRILQNFKSLDFACVRYVRTST